MEYKSVDGIRFNSWVGTANVTRSGTGRILTEFVCDCGHRQYHIKNNITAGKSRQCRGCASIRMIDEDINGDAGKKSKYNGLYTSYRAILNRCYVKSTHCYDSYGGAGVTMCEEWRSSYSAFKHWALSNGWQKGYVCGRFGDVGHYEPSNCKWISKSQSSTEAHKGRRNKHASLSDDVVRQIKFAKLSNTNNENKLTHKILADRFGTTERMVQAIRGGHSYAYIKENE